ncbi:hypothetical protein [Bradyrhizobium sp. USDA 4486]
MKVSRPSGTAIVGSVLTLAMTLSIAGPALAQGTAQQRSACMGDAFRFCSSDIPNVARIEACLIHNRSQLHPACQAEFRASGNTHLHPEHFR